MTTLASVHEKTWLISLAYGRKTRLFKVSLTFLPFKWSRDRIKVTAFSKSSWNSFDFSTPPQKKKIIKTLPYSYLMTKICDFPTLFMTWPKIGHPIYFDDGLINNDEKVASSKRHTHIKTRLQKKNLYYQPCDIFHSPCLISILLSHVNKRNENGSLMAIINYTGLEFKINFNILFILTQSSLSCQNTLLEGLCQINLTFFSDFMTWHDTFKRLFIHPPKEDQF